MKNSKVFTKNCLLLFALLSTAFAGKGQNLVPNGDFEQYISCPPGYIPLDSALNWINPSQFPPGGSPDYLNQCNNGGWSVPSNVFGYQQAHSGVGYCGIILFYKGETIREYAEVMLLSPLVANQCYHVQMYISLCETYGYYTTDDVGFYFSDTLVDGILNWNLLPFTAQVNNATGNYPDTANWTLVSGNYTASGGENYLIIGNFKDDANTDTIAYNTSSTEESYIYIDDVSLTPCTAIEEQNEEAIKIYPNPVEDELLVSGLKLPVGEKEIKITDILGKEIYHNQFLTSDIRILTSDFKSGIYFIEIKNGKNSYRKKFLKE